MAQTILGRVNEYLNEEKWTRAALNNYTVAAFQQFDELLQDVQEAHSASEVLEACEEHLQHTKNSIIALYLAGVIRIQRQNIDDEYLNQLVQIFSDNHRWNIVEYLARRILDFGESRFALRTLAETYTNENQMDKVYEVWERLIRVDYEEADMVEQLARQREQEGKVNDAVAFYKKALHRFINKRQYNNIREIWHKLRDLVPEETEFFFHAESKVAKTISEERAAQLLEDLYPHFRDSGNWDTAIEILKRILSYEPKNEEAREQIVDAFRSKFAEHSQLDEYIRLSNLTQGWRNVHDAIADFEKHISFDAGNYVYHRTWGVGLIRRIDGDEITINFVKKRGHKMSLKMAVNALTILSKDHIWVQRISRKKEDVRKQTKEEPVWALKTIIRSFDNSADMKKVKAELVPGILTQGEWSSWSTKARALLKTDESFGNLPDKPDTYVVREQPITLEEKTFNKFRADKSFFNRVKIIQDFLKIVERQADESAIESDLFREMVDYFVGFVKQSGPVDEMVLSSALLLRGIVSQYPFLNPGVSLDFRELYDRITDLESVYQVMDNPELRREFLGRVRKHVRDWPGIYLRLYPYFLTRDIISRFEEEDRVDEIDSLFVQTWQNFREQREAFVWLVRTGIDEPWFAKLSVSYEKILISMINILDITFRDIDNRRDVAQNRKVNRQVSSFLFEDERLLSYVREADEESIYRIYTLVEDVKDLDLALVRDLRVTIVERFPDFVFFGSDERESVQSGGFFVTPSSYSDKQRALNHLLEVEVPQNSREIAVARELGDLRENAEYKAAKERQDILNNQAARWKAEIEQAKIVDRRDVDASRVSFGTKVKLKNLENESEETYTILGPWESDPNRNVISYLSPFGNRLFQHKPGEELNFQINDQKYHYRVEEIAAAEY